MRGLARILTVLLLLAALPLRGYASVAAGLCDSHHGGQANSHAAMHDHGVSHGDPVDGGGTDSAEVASLCSLCSSCSVSATLAPDPVYAIALSPTGAGPIPFDGSAMPGRVPGTLDRPPLPL
jgi:hypothetical protein